MWREGKEVSLTDGEVEELTKSVKKKDRPKPKRSLTRTSSKRKKSTEDTESEEVSWSEKDSETEDTIVKTKQKYKDLCSENTSSSEVEVEYEPLRTIRMTTRSHALPEVLLLHQRVLEDDSSMEEDLDIPPPQPHSLPAAPPCPASSLSVTPSLLPTAPPAIRSWSSDVFLLLPRWVFDVCFFLKGSSQ
ncbi:hypothetical protein BLNAU_1895 [Blattamonas nauphoetae]|uniref:Uncharacterized protein n=1 Tax=Blattamonas nauphoetae TaxID=2049346 RepID=A0ABQ9YHW7_9EUKA|nr:hypothetical protein BLNAU_1895 [Blattamonas nauphoetae]